MNVGGFGQESSKLLEGQNPKKRAALKVHAYALRFLKDSRSHGISSQAEAPATPDKISDSGIVDMSWEDHLSEVWCKFTLCLYHWLINFYVSQPSVVFVFIVLVDSNCCF